jgi:hypothetical protein
MKRNEEFRCPTGHPELVHTVICKIPTLLVLIGEFFSGRRISKWQAQW